MALCLGVVPFVDNFAHLGGFAAGVVAGLAFYRTDSSRVLPGDVEGGGVGWTGGGPTPLHRRQLNKETPVKVSRSIFTHWRLSGGTAPHRTLSSSDQISAPL